jgi:demethylmenaquinone methyltransferase/2-methoxy-6-polyprenyl-1,4-benzoquinol methylase
MVSAMNLPQYASVLDVACGTGDVSLEILKQYASVTVCGIDISPEMLKRGHRKIRHRKADSAIHLIVGNALELPVASESVDAVTIAFGIRNIVDKRSALEAFYAALKKGGMLVVLELTVPETKLLRVLYLSYFQKILPLIGGFFSRHQQAYEYLPQSVMNFPKSAKFAAIMRSAGFVRVKWKPMTFGIVTLFAGYKA